VIGTILVIFGALAIAGAIFGKDFRAADAITLQESKRKIPAWLGRLLCGVVGVGLIAIGIKVLVGSF